jgi:hypothetical protein
MDVIYGRSATMAPEAPTAPAPEQNEWARVTEAGVLKATELWEAARVLAGVALPARGDWDGLFPTQRVWLSDVMASPKRPKFMNREWKKEDVTYAAVLGATHIAACFAPFCFSWCASRSPSCSLLVRAERRSRSRGRRLPKLTKHDLLLAP